MNKYEKALKKIKSDFWDDPAYYGLEEEFNSLQELVDKETAKEAILMEQLKGEKYTFSSYACPICGKGEVYESNNYCWNCGQKLKFGESEE